MEQPDDAIGFANGGIDHMVAVGAIGPTWARIWLRAARPGVLNVEYRQEQGDQAPRSTEVHLAADNVTDNTASVELGGGQQPLEPNTFYQVVVRYRDDSQVAGEARFATAPADAESAPDRFSIAFMSCNQPFDAEGAPAEHAEAMLEAAQKCMERHDTRFVIEMGDQVYTDYPKSRNMFDRDYFGRLGAGTEDFTSCDAAAVRRLMQQRYRVFWNVDGWRRLHANYPCYPIIDDHDLVDNFGSHPDHCTPAWADFGAGARAAYFDYQGSRVSAKAATPADFDYGFEYGPCAGYLLDMRSNRTAGDDARVYSDEQFDKLRRFLEQQADKAFVLLVVSVPMVHLPRWAAQFCSQATLHVNEDFSDRWSTAGHVHDRDRLFRLLREHQAEHPHHRLMLLSGDIHLACAHEIRWEGGAPVLLQFVASGITNRAGWLLQKAAKLSILANRRVELVDDGLGAEVRLLKSDDGKGQNPYTEINLGILEFERGPDGDHRCRLLIYGRQGSEPVCVFRSPWQNRWVV